jgi:hypothetical protein
MLLQCEVTRLQLGSSCARCRTEQAQSSFTNRMIITQLGLLVGKSEIRPKIYILELCTAFIFGFYFKAGFFDTSKTFSTKTRLVSFSLKKTDKNIIRSASKKG